MLLLVRGSSYHDDGASGDTVLLEPVEVDAGFWGFERSDTTPGNITPEYYLTTGLAEHQVEEIRASTSSATLQFEFTDQLQHNGWATLDVSFEGFSGNPISTPWDSFRYRTLSNATGLGAWLRDTITDSGSVNVTIAEG